MGVLPEPAVGVFTQLSGSGEEPGTGPGAAGLPETGREMATRTRASRCHRPGYRGRKISMPSARVLHRSCIRPSCGAR